MSDSFTEVAHESWFSRIVGAFKSVLIGLLMFVVSFPLLWWNEGRAVHTAQGLSEAGASVILANSAQVDAGNEQRLVHLSGQATTEDELQDAEFGLRLAAIKLHRIVEMYQWKEEKETKKQKKLGGGSETKTTYEYEKTWANHVISSSNFRTPTGHENPASMRVGSRESVAANVKLGAFQLSSELVQQISKTESLPFEAGQLEQVSAELKTNAKLEGGTLYLPNDPKGTAPNPAQPAIGDLRVKFEVVRPCGVSLMARQAGNSFAPWTAKTGTVVERLMVGDFTAAQMVEQMQRENTILTWLLRLGGFLLMAFGIGLMFSPLTVLADVIPFVGDILRFGTGLFSSVIAFFLSLMTIALAWLAYRPLLAIGLIAVGVIVVVLVKRAGASRRLQPV